MKPERTPRAMFARVKWAEDVYTVVVLVFPDALYFNGMPVVE
jgi:hypothetical protein